MRVGSFMKPAGQVISVGPNDTISDALGVMLENKVGAVVVLAVGDFTVAVGIITKTDLVKAYQQGLKLDRQVKEVMSTHLVVCDENMNRDEVAKLLEKHKNHHAIVIEPKTKHFKGILSSFDIAKECAADDRAWPWNRSEDGRFHKPSEKLMGTSPNTTLSHPTSGGNPIKLGDSFRDMMDNLVYFD